MRYEVTGTIMQTVSIALDRGEQLYSQTASMAWMAPSIRMDTHTGGGLFAGIKRALAGGGLFITEFTADQEGEIAFAPRFPGQIVPMTLAAGQSIICRKETFLCAERSVTLDIAFQQRLGAGFFAGEGFIMQRVTGPGTVFLDLSGEVVEKTLAPGERLLVHAGHVGMQEPSVGIDIRMMRGFRNVLFGGEGLFLATLEGPGKVWLQSMPIMNLAEEIGRYLPLGDGERGGGSSMLGIGAGAAAVGGILGSILGNE
ncbi:TIGR00266 family protein [Novosphingobium lentum]|uniref:TIGR00266 family protein n=1 Tax=Novosphingobium lentum TaxID=145287 RepID=UPI0008351412|nr:TIGR00266 family protein [Novosphingobium lentum]